MTGARDTFIEEKQVEKVERISVEVLFNCNKHCQVQKGLNSLEC